jgi:hypothetical protein
MYFCGCCYSPDLNQDLNEHNATNGVSATIVPLSSLREASFRANNAARYRANQNSMSSEEAERREVRRLPASAESFFDYKLEVCSWEPTLKIVICGTRDEKSTLYSLRDHEPTLCRHIYSYLASEWARHVTLTIPASCVGTLQGVGMARFNIGRQEPEFAQREVLPDLPNSSSGVSGFVSFAVCGTIQFPDPADRNVNMMPFIFGDADSLPDNLRCYFDCIEQCPYLQEEVGKIGYLTVHESYVKANQAQRREGLHIESPGVFCDDADAPAFTPGIEHRWGQGVFFGPDRYEGGIYMASSVEDTSIVWDALVDKNAKGIVDRHGGCEHLRRFIGEGTKLRANQLIWMTDCTPHEALPQEEEGRRQFFRVVSSNISHWFADHSTHNPKVPLPDNVTVIHGSKFTV